MAISRYKSVSLDFVCGICGFKYPVSKPLTHKNKGRIYSGHEKTLFCPRCGLNTIHFQVSDNGTRLTEEVKGNMNALQIFSKQEFGSVRMVDIDGKTYAVGNDVAGALGYERPYEAVTTHCKGAVSYRVLTSGGEQTLKVIPEGDIYRLVVKAADQSKNPDIRAKAERFETWIFEEVIPAIRKTGSYLVVAPKSKDEIIMLGYQAAIEKIGVLETKVTELEPKAEFHDKVSAAAGDITVNEAAKKLGTGEKRLFALLRGYHILQNSNLPYQEYIDRGYFRVIQNTFYHSKNQEDKLYDQTVVTGKGLAWLEKFLREKVS